jgi:lysozyme family protein
MNHKEITINNLIDLEGGYVNDCDDSGGETKYGITKHIAIKNGFHGDMADMPRHFAFDLYAKIYWDKVRATELAKKSKAIAEEVFCSAVNIGVNRSAIFLQRSLSVLNNKQQIYPDLVIDGIIGRKTLSAFEKFIEFRGESVLLTSLNCLQGAFYIELAERREKDEKFVYGWIKNRVIL